MPDTPAGDAPNDAASPLEALADIDCHHQARYRVTCLACAAEAVRPGVTALSEQLRDARAELDALRARFGELVESAVPDGEVVRADVAVFERARAALKDPPVPAPAAAGTPVVIREDEDWETVALLAMRQARVADENRAEAVARTLVFAQKTLAAEDRLRRVEVELHNLEVTWREVVVEQLRAEMLPCPAGHAIPAPSGCVWCMRNQVLRDAVMAAEGRYGATRAGVIERLNNLNRGRP